MQPFSLYVCVHLCGYVHISASACRGQKKVLDPLKLELQVVVKHSTWMLRTEFRFLQYTLLTIASSL